MDKDEKRRKSENDDLIRRMRMGESLVRVDVFDMWFPPRPTIKKDKDAIRRLYGVDDEQQDRRAKAVT